MKIHAIKHDSASSQLDLKAFSEELRALSDRYGIKLVSLGAMAVVDSGAKGTTYLAIWETEPNQNQGS
jgi:hypothetical protein